MMEISGKENAHKILMYFFLIPRLLKIYKSSKIVENVVWHHKGRKKDDILRPLAVVKAWKDFVEQYPEFDRFA